MAGLEYDKVNFDPDKFMWTKSEINKRGRLDNKNIRIYKYSKDPNIKYIAHGSYQYGIKWAPIFVNDMVDKNFKVIREIFGKHINVAFIRHPIIDQYDLFPGWPKRMQTPVKQTCGGREAAWLAEG